MYVRPLTTRIIEELSYFRDAVGNQGFRAPVYTAGVKCALLRAGRHFGYQVNATINPDLLPNQLRQGYDRPDFGEFLYDISMCDVAQNGRWCMAAVAESEWKGREYIKEDFEKLLVARAGLRVMVYKEDHIEADTLRQWVDLHEGTHAGDTYLLVAYQGLALPFLYRHIIVRPSAAELVE